MDTLGMSYDEKLELLGNVFDSLIARIHEIDTTEDVKCLLRADVAGMCAKTAREFKAGHDIDEQS